ncbi:MAG: hypothetical protein RSB76_00230 [Clostridia bacterium]
METPVYAAEFAKRQKMDDARKKIIDEVIHVDETTEMEFKDDIASADWDEFVNINSSNGYSNGVVVYARQWAKYMQYKILQGAMLVDIADSTAQDADIYGMSGFMYICAVNALSECWKFGQDLRKWHNKEYNYDGNGIVNPDVLVRASEPSITSKG